MRYAKEQGRSDERGREKRERVKEGNPRTQLDCANRENGMPKTTSPADLEKPPSLRIRTILS